MLFTFVSGLFVISAASCAFVTLQIHYVMPPNLASGLRFLFDFSVALFEFILKLAYIVILFLINIFTYVLSSVIQFVPYLFKTFSTLLSFLLWILTQLIRGVFGMGDKTTNTLSWLFLICAGYLYLDQKYDLWTKPDEETQNQSARENQTPPNNRNERENNRNTADNQTNNERENARRRVIRVIGEQLNDRRGNIRQRGDNPRPQRQIQRIAVIEDESQRLEEENRENENEANTQEEADRTRMHDDNLRNTEREMFDEAPRQAEEIDTTLCVVCLDRERNVAVFPCGHTHLCLTCVQLLRDENGLCPMCQRHIQEFRQIFV